MLFLMWRKKSPLFKCSTGKSTLTWSFLQCILLFLLCTAWFVVKYSIWPLNFKRNVAFSKGWCYFGSSCWCEFWQSVFVSWGMRQFYHFWRWCLWPFENWCVVVVPSQFIFIKVVGVYMLMEVRYYCLTEVQDKKGTRRKSPCSPSFHSAMICRTQP